MADPDLLLAAANSSFETLMNDTDSEAAAQGTVATTTDSEVSLDDVPPEFVCPISKEVMLYPFVTEAGRSYEYVNIRAWLDSGRDKDPYTNVLLPKKTLVPNHNLRLVIEAWFEENREYAGLRNMSVPKPPPEAYKVKTDGLDGVMRYQGPGGGRGGDGKTTDHANEQKLSMATVTTVASPAASTGPSVMNQSGTAATKPKTQTGSSKSVSTVTSDAPTPRRPVAGAAALRPFSAQGHTYTFTIAQGEPGHPSTNTLICDNATTMTMPKSAVRATPAGLVFFDPREMRPTRALPGTDLSEECKFANRCNRSTCTYAHPFVCSSGVSCPNKSNGQCKYFHPPPNSAMTVEASKFKLLCRYGVSCSMERCSYAHPQGRMAIPRARARLFATHTLTLSPLNTAAVPIELAFPDRDTFFQVQDEFVFSFESYPGTWARNYYKSVTVHRFDATTNSYRLVGQFSLDKHYCNCAVAAGNYIIFSFWPYEDEAMRAIWEGARLTRKLQKTINAKSKETAELSKKLADQTAKACGLQRQVVRLHQITETQSAQLQQVRQQIVQLDAVVASQSTQLQQARTHTQQLQRAMQEMDAQNRAQEAQSQAERQQLQLLLHQEQTTNVGLQLAVQQRDTQVQAARQDTIAARQDAATARQERQMEQQRAAKAEAEYRNMQQKYEWERTERLRLRDPIHIYALKPGADGFHKSDWQLVVDYHKGAHDITLQPPGPDGTQAVEFIVDRKRYPFLLMPPSQLASLNVVFPITPTTLCEDF
jgi:hypothetical protein